jgi:hypothetical protein
MPSRKQRRRREKSFRHEYDLVLLDEEGNEVELDPDERRAKREEKESKRAAAKPAGTAARSSRAGREPPVPSWNRALRRGGMMGGVMLLVFIFLLKNGPIGARLGLGLFYAAAFVPLTYFVDRTAYRSYQRRLARKAAAANKN